MLANTATCTAERRKIDHGPVVRLRRVGRTDFRLQHSTRLSQVKSSSRVGERLREQAKGCAGRAAVRYGKRQDDVRFFVAVIFTRLRERAPAIGLRGVTAQGEPRDAAVLLKTPDPPRDA